MNYRSIALGFVLFTQLSRGQTDAALWRYIHPGSKAVIGIDWKKIQQSAAGQMLHEQMTGGTLPVPGVEFLQDIDRVLLSSPGGGDEQSEPPLLIAVRGHFNQREVKTALLKHGAKRQMYGAVPIYRPQGKNGKEFGFVLPDAQTILIGDIASLTSILDKTEFTKSEPNPIVGRAVIMDPLYDFWAVIATPKALGNERLMSLFTGEAFGEETLGFEAGISFRDGMTMNVGISTQSEAAAKKLSAELGKMLKLSAKDKPTNPALAELEKKMKVACENQTVSITLHLTKDELEKNTRVFQASQRKRPNTFADAKPVLLPNAIVDAKPPMLKPAPEKLVIRIDGLDSGPREIPYQPPPND